MQANDAEGRKNDRLRKEKKRRGRNLTKVDRYLQGKRGVPTTGKFRLVAGNTIRAEACYTATGNKKTHDGTPHPVKPEKKNKNRIIPPLFDS